MADVRNNFSATPSNFGENQVLTHYLDLAGLTSFWTKTKRYIDTQDAALYTKSQANLKAADDAMRAYAESLTINNLTVVSNKDAEGQNGVGDSLTLTLAGKDILVKNGEKKEIAAYGSADYKVGTETAKDYTGYTIEDAFTNVDDRLDAIETELAEGVVNSLTITATHDTAQEGVAGDIVEWLKVTPSGNSTGDITVDFDDTAIDSKFEEIDESIADLQANAGVTNIAVKDIDGEGSRTALVEITLEATKAQQFGTKPEDMEDNEWDAYKANFATKSRGDILISLDETALDEALDGIDTTLANEVKDRKKDISLLAGTRYTASAAGAEDGAWDVAVKYTNITDLSERLATIDANLVTKIEEKDSVEKYISFDVASVAAEGTQDNSVTLTIDDSNLAEYINTRETNLAALGATEVEGGNKVLTVNGETLLTVTPAVIDKNGVVTTPAVIASSNVTLGTEHIFHNGAKNSGETTSDILDAHQNAIDALSNATHFIGVTDDVLTDGMTATTVNVKTATGSTAHTLENGDIIICLNSEDQAGVSREYVWNEGVWYELGDITEEDERLTAIENWIDTHFITEEEISSLFNGLDLIVEEDGNQKFA